jgi:hypothetical protein
VQKEGTFQMWSQGFGRGKYLWNQIVDIFDEDGSLNKHKVKIRRTGSGRDDTSYSIKSTADTAEVPTEAGGQTASELIRPVDFFLQKERSIAAAIEKRNADSKTTSLNNFDSDAPPPWESDPSTKAPSFVSSEVDESEGLF